ncbi:related to alcohol dehydrogenase [Sporisorium reilianum SRZ2]|uniref:Related to alcohol dehydrogenase n=1 Tax=Sporisorium reilianum (strain SRZ2) TaxID=999809 RepID=E6ZTA8_SPORE|nr:related to alcohol dehydrogenase [Sporisorium reilianum SRZ2]
MSIPRTTQARRRVQRLGVIPVSDGVGVVLAGARVVTHPSADWVHGELGNENRLGQEQLRLPAHLAFRQAATLPVVGLTAFRSLFGAGKVLQPGQTVLVEGTRGRGAFYSQEEQHTQC